MQTILAWFLVIAVLLMAWPWALWLLREDDGQAPAGLSFLLTLALSTGALTQIMFWQSLTGIAFSLSGITLCYVALMLPGWVWWWRNGRHWPTWTLPQHPLARLTLTITLAISLGVLFTSVYWPFYRDDAVGNYAYFGALMVQLRSLAPLQGSFTVHEAYPMLIPLTYTYSYLAAGWQNEFLARIFPAALSLGGLGAAQILATRLYGTRAGWISLALMVLPPTFGSWAASGYVDLPMAFFYTLSAIFAWQLWQHAGWQNALLAGLMIGLATWTKNAGLVGVPVLGGWLLWAWLHRRITWQHIAMTTLACALVGGPWYLRNLLEANLIMPDTAWSDQAQQTWETLFILVTRPQNYGLAGWFILIGFLVVLAQTLRSRLRDAHLVLPQWWVLPFFAAWWLFASYDPRFIILFLPVMVAGASGPWAYAWAHLPQRWTRPLHIIIAALLVINGTASLWNAIEFKAALLRNPLASAEERRLTVYREHQPTLYEKLLSEQ